MALLPFRLHSLKCPFRAQGRAYNRCKCPVWVDGFVHRKRVLKSLKTRNWKEASQRCQDMELERVNPLIKSTKYPDIATCITQYEAELKARQISLLTQGGYQTILRTFAQFCAETGIHDLRQFDFDLVSQYRQTWKVNAASSRRMLGRLRNFFEYALDRGWVEKNWAKKLKSQKPKQCPTLPFSGEDMQALLAACDERNDPSLRALILLMRYSGLRIGDAASLGVGRVQGEKLFLYTEKTGVPVFCILPDFVTAALAAIEKQSPRYWFWDGSFGKRIDQSKGSLTAKWRWRFNEAAKLASIAGAHPHRIRDTYAVALLDNDVPIRQVQKLLGHSSLLMTEKAYGPWMKDSQRQLEAGLRRANAADPFTQEMQSRFDLRYKGDIKLVSIDSTQRKQTG